MITAKLFKTVQFLYELVLAQQELTAFEISFKIEKNLKTFYLSDVTDAHLLIKRLAYFETVGAKFTDYYWISQQNVTRSINQYLTHWIYPYKGKFHPQMVRALLNILKLNKGDVVLDPFIGSGTTAIEAQLLGINCLGFDVSPLCVLQSNVKTKSLFALPQIENMQQTAIQTVSQFGLIKEEAFTPQFLSFLNTLSDKTARDFYLMAGLIALSDFIRRKRNIIKSFIKNLNLMITSLKMYQEICKKLGLLLGNVVIERGDARSLPLKKNSVDGIITSPPYSIALDYVKNDAHALKALGYDLNRFRNECMGLRGKGKEKIHFYHEDLKQAIAEMFRVLRPRGKCAIIIGNATYQGQKINTVAFLIDCCKELGFRHLLTIEKPIYGLYNIMQEEQIILLEKP